MNPDSAAHLAAGLGMNHHYDAIADSCVTGLPFGNAVLARWPMRSFATIRLPGVALIKPQPRCAVHAVVEVDGIAVSAISTHLETAYMSRRGRVAQARTMAHHRLVSQPVVTVVGGDFNSASALAVRATDRVMAGAGMVRATSGTQETFRRFALPFTLDHLYARGPHSRPLRVNASGVVSSATASDHFPIWTDLAM